MEFVPLLVLGALVYKFIDFLKAAKNKEWNTVATQTIVWVSGVAAILLFASSSFAAGVPVMGDVTLASLGVLEQVIVGLSFASVASVGFDAKKAIDASDTAKTSPLTNL